MLLIETLFNILLALQDTIVSGTIGFNVLDVNPGVAEVIAKWLNRNRLTFEMDQHVCAEFKTSDDETSTYPATIQRKEKLKFYREGEKMNVKRSGDGFYFRQKKERVQVNQSDCEPEYEVKYLDTGHVCDCDHSFIHRPIGWFLDTEFFVEDEAEYTNAMIEGVVKLFIQCKICSFSLYYNTTKDQCFPDAHDAANKNEQGHVLTTGTRGNVVLNDNRLCVEIRCGHHFLFDKKTEFWSQVPGTLPSEPSVAKKRKAVGDESSKKRHCKSPSREEVKEDARSTDNRRSKRKKAQPKVALVKQALAKLERIEKESREIRDILQQLR